MPQYTSKLKLIKPNPAENADVGQLNSNSDAIDDNIGAKNCTSTTRPSQPFVGQHIFETDTGYFRAWNGTRWALISAGNNPIVASRRRYNFAQSWSGGNTAKLNWTEDVNSSPGSSAIIEYNAGDERQFTIKEAGLYLVNVWVAFVPTSSSTAAVYGSINSSDALASPRIRKDFSGTSSITWQGTRLIYCTDTCTVDTDFVCTVDFSLYRTNARDNGIQIARLS